MVTGSTIMPLSDFFDFPHLYGLTVDAHVSVNKTNPPGARHTDGRLGFGHRIHSGRNNGDIQGDILRQSCGSADILAARHQNSLEQAGHRQMSMLLRVVFS